ncbi:MAG TPA: Xaa-Pro peptidase family protein [bacterium]|nr:Xaa-Pro peptidase family protein [bacterium]
MILEPSRAELAARRERLLAELAGMGAPVACLFAPLYVLYLTGFAFIPTERPLALVLTAAGATILFVPRLEQEHAEALADVGRVVSYPEYPGEVHPMVQLAGLLIESGAAGGLAADSDGYGGGFGYRGGRLSDLLPDVSVVKIGATIDRLMAVKSPEEIALLRESARWGDLAHALLQRHTAPGVAEIEVSERASREATAQMLAELGPGYRPHGWMSAGAHAGYRGQIGAHSAVPHALITNAIIRPGDVLVTGATAGMAGYYSELERTLIVAPVSPDAARFFGLMRDMQAAALDALRPGRRCADVDRVVRRFFAEHDLLPYWRHHTGHSIGPGVPNHQAPYLDVGDDTEIVPGMVFSIEPGIYVPGLGGFRHSDTVLVTASSAEPLTTYPRDLERLTIG